MPTVDEASTVKHRFAEQASAPSTPISGFGYLYLKNDGKYYSKDDAGTEYNVSSLEPNYADDWGAPPDSSLKFVGQTSGDFLYEVDGDEIRNDVVSTQTATSVNLTLQSQFLLVLNNASDMTLTVQGSALTPGWTLSVCTLAASGGTGHKILLPSGVTWDGTNRAALLNATTSKLIAKAISTTRFFIFLETDVTYAAS